jgi:hypothetical protein
MSTLTYKSIGRYEMGWSDPRGGSMLGKINLNGGKPTGLTETPTEILRDLWMVQFSSRLVTYDDMEEAVKRDETNVAQELVNRSLVEQRKVSRMDMEKPQYYYALVAEDANR